MEKEVAEMEKLLTEHNALSFALTPTQLQGIEEAVAPFKGQPDEALERKLATLSVRLSVMIDESEPNIDLTPDPLTP